MHLLSGVDTWIVKGGAAVWKNCSTWSLPKMIHRSGRSARNRADLGRRRLDALDRVAILGFRHREELRRMRHHRSTDHA